MKKLKIVSNLLLSFFVVVFAGSIFISWTNFKIKVELPINDYSGFVVDSEENVYIGDSFLSIVQKYDRNGSFMESFHFKEGKGKPFRMLIDDNDNILFKSTLYHDLIVYPAYDRYSTYNIKNVYHLENDKTPTIFISKEKIKYVNTSVYYPSIWKVSGIKKKLVEQNLLLRVFSLPSMCIIIFIALMLKLIIYLQEKLKKWKAKIL